MRKSEYKAGAFLVDGSGHVFIHDGYIGFVLNDNCTPAWSFTALMKVLRSLRCNCRDLGVHYNCIPNVFCVGFNYKDSCDSHIYMHMEGEPFETMVRAIEYLHRVMAEDLREMFNRRNSKRL
jgi:hypothetical protein